MYKCFFSELYISIFISKKIFDLLLNMYKNKMDSLVKKFNKMSTSKVRPPYICQYCKQRSYLTICVKCIKQL